MSGPFLGVPKAALIALCRAQGWTFVEDPSNRDDRFARVRWRKLMPRPRRRGPDAGAPRPLAGRARRRGRGARREGRRRPSPGATSAPEGTACGLRGAVLAAGALRDRRAGARLGARRAAARRGPAGSSRLEACARAPAARRSRRARPGRADPRRRRSIRLDRTGDLGVARAGAPPGALSRSARDDAAARAAFPWQGGRACLDCIVRRERLRLVLRLQLPQGQT